MNQVAQLQPAQNGGKRSLIADMATRYGMEREDFYETLMKTVVPEGCTKAEFAAFCMVANTYDLNPITKEIYAFPKKGGGIQPIVSIDGWMNLMNSHPQMNGIEFEDRFDEHGQMTAITARIWRKGRDRPTEVTEYMDECKTEYWDKKAGEFKVTEPWQKWPRRMLRHKAAIQAARYAFGFAGIMDPDEAERAGVSQVQDVQLTPPPVPKDTIEDHSEPADEPNPDEIVIEEADQEPAPTPPPATHQEAMERLGDIPEDLDRKPKAEEPEQPLDLDAWVTDQIKAIKGAKTPDDLNAIWDNELSDKWQDLPPPDQTTIEDTYQAAHKKLSGDPS